MIYKYYDCSGLTTIKIGSGVKEIKEQAFMDCPELSDVYCYADNVPSTKSNAFSGSYIEYLTLHVPKSALEQYKKTAPWSNFGKIVSLEGSTPPTPETKKCAKPTINYSDGKLSFNCETKGAEFVTNITDTDINKFYDAEITLSVTYNISVYATRAGYENSDVATATLCWIDATPQTEGIANNVANIQARAVLIQSSNNTFTIEGAEAGTAISVYDTSGKLVGSANANGEGATTINTSLRNGDIGIVKIGDKSVKVAIK